MITNSERNFLTLEKQQVRHDKSFGALPYRKKPLIRIDRIDSSVLYKGDISSVSLKTVLNEMM